MTSGDPGRWRRSLDRIKWRPDALDVFGVVGFASLFYGVHQVHPPSAFIASGVILLGISVWKASR